MLARTLATWLSVALLMSLSAIAQDAGVSLAAMRGDRAMVRTLLDGSADVNHAMGDGTTALHWAAYRTDLDLARMLIQAGANVEAVTRLGDISPLFMAAESGSAEMIALLLGAGADPNSSKSTGTTPLMLAAASGDVDAVGMLLERGADVNSTENTHEQTALMYAAARGRVDVIRQLAQAGADTDASTKVSPIGASEDQYRSRNQNRPRTGADPIAMGGMTALHFSAREGQIDAIRELVWAGADVNKVNGSDRISVMTMAIINGHLDIAEFLLANGGNPTLASDTGLAPLYATIDAQWAARTWYPPASIEEERIGYLDLMKKLLASGADPNERIGPEPWFRSFHGDWIDAAGATAFWRAAQSNDLAAMKLLIAAGADPHIPTTHLASALQAAAGFGHEPQVTNLVPGARTETILYLVDQLGADVKSNDDKGYTPLHGAALVGANDVILYLISKGADVTAKANMIYGRADDGNRDVDAGTGDTVVDMANGPRERSIIYPETINLLVGLGAENSDNCRASVCVLKTILEPDDNQ